MYLNQVFVSSKSINALIIYNRFILLRRFFALAGTVFLLRCFTMLITSLSVPGSHLKCEPRSYPPADDLTVWGRRLRQVNLFPAFFGTHCTKSIGCFAVSGSHDKGYLV